MTRNHILILKGIFSNMLIFLDFLLWLTLDFTKFKKIEKTKIKRVLIIHKGAIGELLATTPLAKTLKEELGAKISYLVNPRTADVLINNPNVDNIIYYKEKFSENLEEIRKGCFDLAIILWPSSYKIALYCKKAGIRFRIGCYSTALSGPAFFYHWRRWPFGKKHAVEMSLDFLKPIGLKNTKPKTEFYYEKKDEEKASSYLKSEKIKDFVIIHPGFGSANKRLWPIERYAKVADTISKEFKLKIVYTGLKEEEDLCLNIRKLSKNKKYSHIAAGKFSLKELGALVKKSKLVIAPDTGIVHISAALNTPIVDLVCREGPSMWRPWMDEKMYRLLFHPTATLSERNNSEKISLETLEAISADEVITAARQLLSQK